jgi:hypothetical protein
MIRIGPAYQASMPPQIQLASPPRTPYSPSADIDAFLRRCAVFGLPAAFAGSDGAREELCIETLRSCHLDEDRAICDLRSLHYENRYDKTPPAVKQKHRPTKGKAREDKSIPRAGDCVFLRSPPDQKPYIALIEKAYANGTLTCRWFYRHADLHPTCMTATAPSDFELFLSPVRNKNGADKVIGRCTVTATANGKTHFCRSLYMPKTRTIVATRLVRELQTRV